MCVDEWVCLSANRGGTNRNHWTQTCDLVCTDLLMNRDRMPKTRSFWSTLLYFTLRISKSSTPPPKKKWAWIGNYQASWGSQPMECLFLFSSSVFCKVTAVWIDNVHMDVNVCWCREERWRAGISCVFLRAARWPNDTQSCSTHLGCCECYVVSVFIISVGCCW